MSALRRTTDRAPREEWLGLRALPHPAAATPDALWPELVVAGWERVHNHAVSPDGSRVAFLWDRDGYSDLWLLPIEGRAFPQRLTLHRPHVNWWEDEPPAWSPDGQWLVYGAYDEGVSHLYAIASGGGAPRQLTEFRNDASEPCFSPDGRHLVFSTQKGDTSQIAMLPFDGGWAAGLTPPGDECTTPVWSPDGARIIYSASPQHGRKQNDIYGLGVEGAGARGTPARLTPDDNIECWSPAFSPDGARIAMLSNRSGHDEIWLMAPDGSGQRQASRLGLDVEEFAWSHDGTRLIALVNRRGCDCLFVVDAHSGEARALGCPAGNYSGPQWVRGRDAIVVGFDAPDSPPALYLFDLASGAFTSLTDTCASALRRASFVTPVHIDYDSTDGWAIPGFLYEPAEASPGPRGRPGIVYPHGGPTAHYDLAWDPVRQYFVAKGYAVLCPNFRGSTGYGRAFKEGNLNQWGAADLNDCLAAADCLVERAGADRQRLAIWGQSYGGYLTQLALGKDRDFRFRCGVSLYGDSHLRTSWASGDHSGRQDLEWQMGEPGVNAERYEAGSPINFVRNFRAPLLVLHGELDARVALSESLQLVEALKREGKTFEFFTYPEEGHGFAHAENALDALERIERFLDWWLL